MPPSIMQHPPLKKESDEKVHCCGIRKKTQTPSKEPQQTPSLLGKMLALRLGPLFFPGANQTKKTNFSPNHLFSEEEDHRIRELRIALLSNLALASLRQKKYRPALNFCEDSRKPAWWVAWGLLLFFWGGEGVGGKRKAVGGRLLGVDMGWLDDSGCFV